MALYEVLADGTLNRVAGNAVSIPIGTMLAYEDDTKPASIYGGTWEHLKDKFILGAGDIYAVGSTGGEATHTLTVAEMPNHSHTEVWCGYDGSVIYNYGLTYGSGSNWGININKISIPNAANTASSNYLNTWDNGGSQAHNNMPPYKAFNVWIRIG